MSNPKIMENYESFMGAEPCISTRDLDYDMKFAELLILEGSVLYKRKHSGIPGDFTGEARSHLQNCEARNAWET